MVFNDFFDLAKNTNPLIDSFEILIDLKKISFTERGFKELYNNLVLVDLGTGEIFDNHDKRFLFLEKKGVKIYVKIKNLFGKEFLSLSVTSKYLHDRYFDGISLKNIRIIYDNLMSYLIDYLFFDYSVFLNSSISDIDLFFDFIKDYHFLFSLFNEMKKFNDNFRTYKFKNKYTGLVHLQRSYSNKKYKYFKIYNKFIEFNQKSKDFYDNYLFGDVSPDLWRFEFTLKNSTHIKQFLKLKTFENSLVNFLYKLEKYDASFPLLPFVLFKKERKVRIDYSNFSNNELFLLKIFESWQKNKLIIYQLRLVERLFHKNKNDKLSFIDDLDKYLSDNLVDYLACDLVDAFFKDVYGDLLKIKQIRRYLERKKSFLKKNLDL